jgi:alpha-1,3-rhamnosyl/mannosyltransferase
MKQRLLRSAYVSAARRADAGYFHSEFALSQLERWVPGLRRKSRVALTGMPQSVVFDKDEIPAHPLKGRPYFLYLSAIYPYKNHVTLIKAYAMAAARTPDLPELLIAGFCDDEEQLSKIRNAIVECGVQGTVRYLGPLPQADISAWLHHATANVFPSTCETNSIVIAEILGSHGVLACSSAEPFPEVVGRAGVFFDPCDAASISTTLVRLASDEPERRRLRAMAAQRAAEFSWDACGTALWDAARAAVEARRKRVES